MPSETMKRKGYAISYLVGAFLLFALQAAGKSPVGYLVGAIFLALAAKNYFDWQRLKKREEKEAKAKQEQADDTE